MACSTIERWHEIVKSRDITSLKTLLADDTLFEAPPKSPDADQRVRRPK